MISLPIVTSPAFITEATQIAGRLGASVIQAENPRDITSHEFVLWFTDSGLGLQQTGPKAPNAIAVNFTEGAVDHRRKFGGGKGQMIAKACGVKAGCYPHILDATAGLGRDAFVLASLGCRMTLIERSPIVYELLKDGLERGRLFAASEDAELAEILNRLALVPEHIDSLAFLNRLTDIDRPDVIYLDPMFPERQKSADVKKEMKAFHSIVGADLDADALLPLALEQANYRVVVKRPRKAPFLNSQAPSYQLEGKSSRFDIYTRKKMPDTLGSGSE